MRALTAKDEAGLLEFAPLIGGAKNVQDVRRTLAARVRRIELDPANRKLLVRYRINLTSVAGGAKLATPRGFEPRLPP